jgi:hypothetical protein
MGASGMLRPRLAALFLGLAAGCSDGSGRGPGPGPVPSTNPIAALAENVAPLTVDVGLPDIGYVNGLFATVTVCVPGTEDCQTIDHVVVDTGSSGLRLLGSVLTLPLPVRTDTRGVPLAECYSLISGLTWGPLHEADFRIAGEQASQIAIQVIEESTYPVPDDCTGVRVNTAKTLAANGILGLSTYLYDCGTECTQAPGPWSSNPGNYYACSDGGCLVAAVPLSQQMTNPVFLFGQDNNGTIIELPVFGIGTRENNNLDQAVVFPLDQFAMFKTRYPVNSTSLWPAFLDSGSNGIYFLDSATAGLPICAPPYDSFYCPKSTTNLTAINQDNAGLVATTVNFRIANANDLAARRNNSAFDCLGGPALDPATETSVTDLMYFDWGLPFYFGRNVFTALEGQSTPAGEGPFVAY